jgi:hypothetical protein
MRKTQREKTLQKYKMRDYRSQKRLAELKLAIFQLKEKTVTNEAIFSGEAKEIFHHAVLLVAQI